jgi:hypothetical protein
MEADSVLSNGFETARGDAELVKVGPLTPQLGPGHPSGSSAHLSVVPPRHAEDEVAFRTLEERGE